MALALYRKYRPRTFAEVIGQEHVTEPLSQALRSGRLNHAYLFSGPRGCGKTSSARILARSLNCEQGPTPEPCGVCMSCKSLANDGAGSIDVIEIDAASHGGVDDARELREKAFFAPANSRYKIYVIDEAHMVSSAGFNALLKLVEEPPEYVKFIFATTEPDKVLGTIRSRTHHYPFRLIPPATLRPYLQQLTEAEGVTVDPAVFPLVVRAGGGSARDSLSVLDQLIAGAGPDGVSYARAVALLGVTDAALLDEMCEALAATDGAAAYETIDRVAEAGHDPRRYASDLLERLRDLIVLQQVPDAVAKGLIDGPADQLEAMHTQASRLGAATLSRCADIVHNGLVEMRGTTAPRLLLELITARMLLPGAEDSTGALLQRLERLEKQGPISAVRDSADAAAPAVASVGPVVASDEDVPSVAPVSGGSGGGLAAARAAAAAASRAKSGPARPVSAAPVSPAPAPVAPVSAPAASSAASPAAPEAADWNQVADGGHDEAPPWDEEPPAPVPTVSAPAAPAAPVAPVRQRAGLPQVRAVWEAFGAKDPKIQVMQGSGIGLREVDGDTVYFSAPNPRYAERFLTFSDHIAAEFAAELGDRWQIRCDAGEPGPRGRDQSAERDQFGGRDQSAGRRMPAARPPSAAPEHNTGRTESRPSRPQRTPAADADDDWPAPLPPEPTDDPYASAPHPDAYADGPPAGSQATGRSPSAHSAGQSSAGSAQAAGRPGGASPAGPAERQAEPAERQAEPAGHPGSGPAGREPAAVTTGGGDTDWPEPVRPGSAAPRSPQPPAAEEDWPEPVKPGTRPPASTGPVANSAPASAGWDSSAAPADPPSAPSPVNQSAPGGSASWSGPAGPEASPPVGNAAGTGIEAQGGFSAPPATGPAPSGQMPNSAEPPIAAAAPYAGPSAHAATPAAPASAPPATASPASISATGGSAASISATAGSVAAGQVAARPAPDRPAAGRAASPAPAAASAAPARSAAMEAARAAAARGGNAGGGGLAAARAAAANATKSGSNRAAAPASGDTASSAWSDGTPIGEAPYDPEYDGPPSAASGSGSGPGYEGFDPGDEPLDEVIDEKVARQSSEEQAMQLLRDAFGVEKIGEM